jgi:CheY-like chemotaxis protein
VDVLIADGDEHALAVWGSQLEAAGFRVTRARTGFEAIVKASCHVPELIVLGEPLSDIGAIETVRMIATCPMTAHIPVVRMTARQKLPRRILSIARQAAL